MLRLPACSAGHLHSSSDLGELPLKKAGAGGVTHVGSKQAGGGGVGDQKHKSLPNIATRVWQNVAAHGLMGRCCTGFMLFPSCFLLPASGGMHHDTSQGGHSLLTPAPPPRGLGKQGRTRAPPLPAPAARQERNANNAIAGHVAQAQSEGTNSGTATAGT